jgi:hypothetical protein
MTTENIKSSYSLPLLIILPLRRLKGLFHKIEANFITGILIGAIFSLLVNILTNQIGESITRQKSLEALEIELNDHHFTNTSMVNFYNSGDYKKGALHVYIEHRYSDNIWKSLGSTTFFYSLPPKTQGLLLSYYSSIIGGTNPALSNNDQIVRNYQTSYLVCQFSSNDCTKEMDLYNKVSDFYNQQQYSWGLFVDKYDFNISQEFHPTRDRLNDPILSFLMGKQSVKSLALPWK